MHFDAGQFEIGCGYVVIIVPVILDIELSLCHVKGENCSNEIKESRFSNFRHIKHQRDKQIALFISLIFNQIDINLPLNTRPR